VGYRAAVASLILFMLGAIALLRGVPDARLHSRRASA
jgi:hypothetical protein